MKSGNGGCEVTEILVIEFWIGILILFRNMAASHEKKQLESLFIEQTPRLITYN